MATRVYFRSEGTPDITPSTWNFANQVNPVSFPATLLKNSASAMTSKTEATGTTNPIAKAMGRIILGPVKAQTVTGTVKGQMRGSESNVGANATLALAVKFIKPDGTDRAVLLAQTASDAATAGHELTTVLTNMSFQDVSENAAITLTSGAALDGDYLVIEWGFRSATAQDRNITLSYGNDSATDLPEDTSTTTANNPWVEFSQTLLVVRQTVGASAGTGASSVVGAAIGSATGASSGIGASAVIGAAFNGTTASSTGLAVATGTGASFASGAGSTTGASVASATAIATNATTGAASGSASAGGIGESTNTGTGISQGAAQVIGTLAVTSSGIASALGSSITDASGAFVTAAVGVASGSSAGSGTLMVIASIVGVSQGLSTSSFVLTATSAGESVSEGSGSVVGASAAISASDGSATSVSIVSGVVSAIHWAVGESLSISLAEGVSDQIDLGSVGNASGVATCFASGSGVRHSQGASVGLSVTFAVGDIVRPPSAEILIDTENRIIKVDSDARMVYVVGMNERTTIAASENRRIEIPFEDRTA